eukprot:1766423-Amphidinium_carterae.1
MARVLAEQALSTSGLSVASFRTHSKVRDRVVFDISSQSAAELASSLLSGPNAVLLTAGPMLPSTVRFPAKAATHLVRLAAVAQSCGKAVLLVDSPATHARYSVFKKARRQLLHWEGCACQLGCQEHVQLSLLLRAIPCFEDLRSVPCNLCATQAVPASVLHSIHYGHPVSR